jgi:hypothetical protein
MVVVVVDPQRLLAEPVVQDLNILLQQAELLGQVVVADQAAIILIDRWLYWEAMVDYLVAVAAPFGDQVPMQYQAQVHKAQSSLLT